MHYFSSSLEGGSGRGGGDGTAIHRPFSCNDDDTMKETTNDAVMVSCHLFIHPSAFYSSTRLIYYTLYLEELRIPLVDPRPARATVMDGGRRWPRIEGNQVPKRE